MGQISEAEELCFLLTGAADIEDIVVINADISLLPSMIMLATICRNVKLFFMSQPNFTAFYNN